METVLAHKYNFGVLWKGLISMLAKLSRTRTQDFCKGCSQRKDAPFGAQPVSPPTEIDDNLFGCYVDFDSQLYQIYWTTAEKCPDLSRFPLIDGTVHKVELSAIMARTLSDSVLLNYGVDGIIRCTHFGRFPVVKMSHPTKTARRRIQHEFKMLQEMKRQSLPVPSFHPEPLIDNEGIFGYSMEHLSPIDYSDLHSISTDVQAMVKRVHNCGFSHGDLNPSNIMRNETGKLVLIDTSFSGRLGTCIPDHITSYQYRSSTFDTDADQRYLELFFP